MAAAADSQSAHNQELTMDAVFLDAGSLDRGDLDLTSLHEAVGSLTCYEATAPADVVARLEGAGIAIVNKVVLNREVLAPCPSLELICVVATGTNNVDLEAAAEQGIQVVNCRDYATDSVAEHVLGLMLGLVRHLPDYTNDVQHGAWQASPFFCRLDYPITELRALTLGVVGYGNLGQATAALARGIGMSVLVAEQRGSASTRSGRVAFDACLRDSDIVTLHCPLTETTRELIGPREIALIGASGYLINTARGALIDEQALATALAEGRLAGAALDVLTQEPPTDSNPLIAEQPPNLLITPHCAWGSRTARCRVVEQTAANIHGFLAGETPRRVV